MKHSKEELQESILYFAKKYNKGDSYTRLMCDTTLPSIVKMIIYDMFLKGFDYAFETNGAYEAYQIILDYSREMDEKGFVEFATSPIPKEIHYDDLGIAIGDYNTERWLNEFLSNDSKYVKVSSQLVITALRVRIKNSPILLKKVKVTVGKDRDLLKIDEYGRIENNEIMTDYMSNYFLKLWD